MCGEREREGGCSPGEEDLNQASKQICIPFTHCEASEAELNLNKGLSAQASLERKRA